MTSELPVVHSIEPPEGSGFLSLEVEVIVLPREIDGEGRGVYHDSAVTLVKELAPFGVSAAYAHDQGERLFYGERNFSAGVVNWVIGIASSGGWAALCWLVRKQYSEARVRLKIARCSQTANETTWEWFEVEGRGTDVADALDAFVVTREKGTIAAEERAP